MQLPPDVQERLAKEYRFAATRMRDESDPLRKVYFFSALFTEISRILNWHWDRDLVLLHCVLAHTHANLAPRVQPSDQRFNPGQVSPLLATLVEIAEGLADFMEQGAEGPELYELLGRVAEIGYLSTQHGGYVMEKGLVHPDSI